MEDPTPDPVDSHRPSEDLPVLYSPLISEEPVLLCLGVIRGIGLWDVVQVFGKGGEQ